MSTSVTKAQIVLVLTERNRMIPRPSSQDLGAGSPLSQIRTPTGRFLRRVRRSGPTRSPRSARHRAAHGLHQ
ncbi:conserved domain protein [Actinomyces sp. oral taxon 170 str. F0386]|nr:conserved domain protein [Actinomyces sp. oral taxon 170 str. F0386]